MRLQYVPLFLLTAFSVAGTLSCQGMAVAAVEKKDQALKKNEPHVFQRDITAHFFLDFFPRIHMPPYDRIRNPPAFYIKAVRRKRQRSAHHIISPMYITMGYLHELRQELEQMLGDELDEESKKAVLHFVGTKVYDSWKNGVEQGKAQAQLGTTENAFKKNGKRFSKKSHKAERPQQ